MALVYHWIIIKFGLLEFYISFIFLVEIATCIIGKIKIAAYVESTLIAAPHVIPCDPFRPLHQLMFCFAVMDSRFLFLRFKARKRIKVMSEQMLHMNHSFIQKDDPIRGIIDHNGSKIERRRMRLANMMNYARVPHQKLPNTWIYPFGPRKAINYACVYDGGSWRKDDFCLMWPHKMAAMA